MGDSVGHSFSIPDELGHLPSGPSKKYEELKLGEYTLDFGKCYACGKIERAEGENHSYFVIDNSGNKQFISKECWSKALAEEIVKNPYISPKLLRKIEERKRISKEEKSMEAAANFLR